MPRSRSQSVISNGEIHSLQEAFEQLDVHALKFVFLTKSCLPRLVWLLLFVGGCGAAGYYIRQILLDFLSRQTATKITTKILEEYDYPPIYICPRYNWQLSKASEHNLSLDAVIHAALLGQRNISEKPLPPMQMDPIFAEDRLHRFIHQNPDIKKKTYAEFYKWMALDSKSILQEAAGVQSKEFSSVFVASPNPQDGKPVSYRACYNVSAGKYNPHTGEVFYLQYSIDKPTEGYFGYDTDFAYIKDEHRVVLEKDRIYLRTNRITTIRLSIKQYSRRETKESGCKKPEEVTKEYSQQYCRYKCFAEAVDKCSKCKLLTEDTELIGSNLLCSWSSTTNLSISCHERDLGTYKQCLGMCEPLCEYNSYDFSIAVAVLNASSFVDSRIGLWIYFLVDDGILVYQEIPIYNFETFISNIGGQMGLWTGASILTIIELVYLIMQFFCADWEIRKVKRRRGRDSARDTRESVELEKGEKEEDENEEKQKDEKHVSIVEDEKLIESNPEEPEEPKEKEAIRNENVEKKVTF